MKKILFLFFSRFFLFFLFIGCYLNFILQLNLCEHIFKNFFFLSLLTILCFLFIFYFEKAFSFVIFTRVFLVFSLVCLFGLYMESVMVAIVYQGVYHTNNLEGYACTIIMLIIMFPKKKKLS